jgi:hypothetical protein
MRTFTFCRRLKPSSGLVPSVRFVENVISDEMELIIAAELKPWGG